MPIDLKWVRQNPQVVEEWQRLRGRSSDVVQEVLRQDEFARSKLQSIQQAKRSLAAIKQQLRPCKKNDNDNAPSLATPSREELLEEKKSLEDRIESEERSWKEAVQLTEALLWKVSSPVDLSLIQLQPSEESRVLRPNRLDKSLPGMDADEATSQIGMELQHAVKSYALKFFAEYPGVQILSGIQVEQAEKKDPNRTVAGVINPDVAHAIWGCCTDHFVSTGQSETSQSRQPFCPICRVSANENFPSITRPVMLPTWVRLLTEYIPPKSIWGDKQLPVFAAVWSNKKDACELSGDDNILSLETTTEKLHAFSSALESSFSLDLVALTASSMVDARQIQTDMVNQIIAFYEGLLSSTMSSSHGERRMTTKHTQPSMLAFHECSRIEVLMDVSGASSKEECTVCLGKVSCWGDAASRACDMAFAGGGVRGKNKHSSQNMKDFVYVVQASVVDANTWGKILNANLKNCEAGINSETCVEIPPILIPCLNHQDTRFERNGAGNAFIAWNDLFVRKCTKTKKKESTVLGPLMKQFATQTVVEAAAKPRKQDQLCDDPKFPMIDVHEKNDPRNEALACPFEFLLH